MSKPPKFLRRGGWVSPAAKRLNRKLKRRQITCWCYVYPFPHRINGGKCRGRDWAQSYYELDRWACSCCASNCNTYCEVANGQEDIKHCGGYRDHLLSNTNAQFPKYEL